MTADGTAPVPYFESPPPPTPYARRLLVISANFPPSRAVGGLRWQKMSQFAAERGWGTDVISVPPTSSADQDPERLNDLPPGLRIFATTHPGPLGESMVGALLRMRRWRRNAGAPSAASSAASSAAPSVPATGGAAVGGGSVARADVRGFRPWKPRDVLRALTSSQWIAGDLAWARQIVAVGRRVLGPEHRAIVSSGPPHFAHVAAHRLSREFGLPHVVDFRDPWSLTERLPPGFASPLYLRTVRHYERQALEHAALVVANTELAARSVRDAYPALASRVVTVMNGSDDEAPPAAPRDERFLIAYAGAIYFDRDPRLLFRAAKRVIGELGITPAQFGMELMGPVDVMSPPVMELARQEGVEAFVRYHPPGARSAAARLLASASMLVSLPQDTETAIPSKIFEYATYDAWLLALAKRGSASALVLEGSSADVVAPDDVDGIADVLRRHYQEFAAGVRPRAAGGDGRFSRRRQGEIMLDHLDRLTKR
jgi:glycosyltransferase involved in cell wall biosynthesis